MSKKSRMHGYFNRAKERMDEMDAALASVENSAEKVKADSKEKAHRFVADLRKRRDEFEAAAKKQADAGEAAVERSAAHLERQWEDFDAQIQAYFDTVDKQIEHRQAAFGKIAAAQVKAWRKAADEFHDGAAKVAAAGRADLDAAVKQMKAKAAEAEERFQKLKQAGSESWSALNAALAQSRKAFDEAHHKAWDAFTRAAPPSA